MQSLCIAFCVCFSHWASCLQAHPRCSLCQNFVPSKADEYSAVWMDPSCLPICLLVDVGLCPVSAVLVHFEGTVITSCVGHLAGKGAGRVPSPTQAMLAHCVLSTIGSMLVPLRFSLSPSFLLSTSNLHIRITWGS